MGEKPIRQSDFEVPNGNKVDPATVTELIRSAERFISSGKYGLAMDQLAYAQTLDSGNTYIPAILDRLQNLQHSSSSQAHESVEPQGVESPESKRYLSVTVGTEFKSGVRGPGDDAPESPQELQVRIRRLTNAAENFLETGSFKNAFDSLMKAYLLDPMSPYVITCEKSVLPEWERARRQETKGGQEKGEMGLEDVFRPRP